MIIVLVCCCMYCVALLIYSILNEDEEVHTICECLLIIHEAYAAEGKMLHVQKAINQVLASGKLHDQMQKLMTKTNKKVTQAIFCLVSRVMHAFAECVCSL